MTDEQYMRLAIEKAKEGVEQGNTPFGSCVVRNGKVICTAHNQVWNMTDITAHAEVTALRRACKVLGTVDLSGCTLYSTCEPCPMCFSAIHWSRISKIVYGARIEDAKSLGFNELTISNDQMKKLGGSGVEIEGPFLLEENLELFRYWESFPEKKIY
jgi:tRNA(Arg) A34 adenosine deaminase TadA